MSEFIEFPKIARLNRDVIITEKIDGTNAQVSIEPIDEARGGNVPVGDEVAVVKVRVVESVPGVEISDVDACINYGVKAGSRNRWLAIGKDNFGFALFVQKNAEALVRALGPGRHYGEWWGPGIQRGYGLAQKRFSLFNVSRWGKVESYLDPRCAKNVDVKTEWSRTYTMADPLALIHQYDRAGVKRCACRDAREAISLDLEGGSVRSVPVLYEGPWFIDSQSGLLDDNPPGHSVWAPAEALYHLRLHGSSASPGFMRPEGIVLFHTAGSVLFKATLEGDEKHKGEA